MLHLGFLDLNGGLGRRFGSIGLAIDGLRTSITIGAAPHMRVTGPENKRVHGYLQTMQRALDSDSACHVTINEVVPAHAGLGSGTQLSLAVAAGMRSIAVPNRQFRPDDDVLASAAVVVPSLAEVTVDLVVSL